MLERVKQFIHDIDMHASDFSVMCGRAILSFVDTLKKINLNSGFFDEFSTIFYNEKSTVFNKIFSKFINHCFNDIAHPVILK